MDQTRNLGFRLPTVHFGKLGFQLRCADTVGFAEIFLFVDRVLFNFNIVQLAVAHHHGVKHGVLVKRKVILAQNRHTHGLGDRHLARRRLQLTAKDLKEGGFSRAIGSDDAVAVAGCEFEVNVLKEQLTAKVKTQIGDCDHDIPLFTYYLFYYNMIFMFLQPRCAFLKKKCCFFSLFR